MPTESGISSRQLPVSREPFPTRPTKGASFRTKRRPFPSASRPRDVPPRSRGISLIPAVSPLLWFWSSRGIFPDCPSRKSQQRPRDGLSPFPCPTPPKGGRLIRRRGGDPPFPHPVPPSESLRQGELSR